MPPSSDVCQGSGGFVVSLSARWSEVRPTLALGLRLVPIPAWSACAARSFPQPGR